jgi:phage repressor protein C with HTH and peptisase S24 domain
MSNEETIGTRLEKLALIAGSRKTLARIADTPDSTLMNWERGLGMRESKFLEVARNLGVSAEWLRDGIGDEETELENFRLMLNPKIGGARGKLIAALKKRGWSPGDLARRIKHDPGVIENVINGTGRASENMIEAIVLVMPELSKEDLMDGSEQVRIEGDSLHAIHGQNSPIVLPLGMKGRAVPLLTAAQAGGWDAGHHDEGWTGDSVFALNLDDRRAFAVRVSGNSMEPEIFEGDVVICSPRQQLTNGDCAVVRTRSEHAYVKYWRKNGEVVLLESENKSYDPIKLPATEIVGAWPVIQRISYRKIKSLK